TFKAYTLTAWLEAGRSHESRLDAPANLPVPDKPDGISAYATQDRGTITVFDAMAQSANTVFAQMQQELGADPIVDVATRLGLPDEVDG
ncbi:glycosyl transferase family 51, partial [Enterococcus hirae]